MCVVGVEIAETPRGEASKAKTSQTAFFGGLRGVLITPGKRRYFHATKNTIVLY